MKVLIVDDSKVISQGLEKLLLDIKELEITGIAVDGLEAIQFFNEQHPDIVVLDLMIPKLNGMDVLKYIRAHSENTIIIILTNYHQSYFRDLTKKLGADYFLDKSIDFEKVAKICTDIINNQQFIKKDQIEEKGIEQK